MTGCGWPQTASGIPTYENCIGPPMGLYPYPGPKVNSAIEAQYKIVALRNKPAGSPADFAFVAEACLRARGLLYAKAVPGDCASGARPTGGVTSGQIVGL